MRAKLTQSVVETAASKDRAYEIRDTELKGLIFRVQPSGVKTFYVELARSVRERIGSYPVTTVKAARTQAIAKLAEYARTGQRASPRSKVETLGTYLDEHYGPWVTVERKAGAATLANIQAQFADYLKKPLTALTAWNVEKFKADRLRAGLNPATVNRDLGRIKAALAKAVEWKILPDHPLRTVKPAKGADNSRVRFLSKPEEAALRKALVARDAQHSARRDSANQWRSQRKKDALPRLTAYADHVTPMTLVALNTGLRRGELTSITWEDVNLVSKMLTVRAGYAKSDKPRYVPLNKEAVQVLKAWKKQHGSDGRLFAVDSVKKAWAALLTSAKLTDFKFHDCRHTFASKLVMAGVDLNTVRELLGHAKIEMTLRYAHLAPEHKAAAVEKLVRA
jgi:integrase